MKKQITFLLIGLGVMAFSTMSFAESFNKPVRTMVGKIESINASKNVIVIKDIDVPKYETVRVYSDQVGSLQVGQEVTAAGLIGGGILTLQK